MEPIKNRLASVTEEGWSPIAGYRRPTGTKPRSAAAKDDGGAHCAPFEALHSSGFLYRRRRFQSPLQHKKSGDRSMQAQCSLVRGIFGTMQDWKEIFISTHEFAYNLHIPIRWICPTPRPESRSSSHRFLWITADQDFSFFSPRLFVRRLDEIRDNGRLIRTFPNNYYL